MTPLVLSMCSQTPCKGKAPSSWQKCKLQGIQRSSQAVRSRWPDIIKFNLPHFQLLEAGIMHFFFFNRAGIFCERFTSQDIAVGVHQYMATYSVSCLLSSSSQPSCCPCCFFFFFPGWNADVCSFLRHRSLGFSGKTLQFKCNYCFSSLCHRQLH